MCKEKFYFANREEKEELYPEQSISFSPARHENSDSKSYYPVF